MIHDCPCETCDCKDALNECCCVECRALDQIEHTSKLVGRCAYCGSQAETYQAGACHDCLKRTWERMGRLRKAGVA